MIWSPLRMQISKTEFVSKIKSYSSNCVRCREGLKMSLAYYFSTILWSPPSFLRITLFNNNTKYDQINSWKIKWSNILHKKCCITLSLVVPLYFYPRLCLWTAYNCPWARSRFIWSSWPLPMPFMFHGACACCATVHTMCFRHCLTHQDTT